MHDSRHLRRGLVRRRTASTRASSSGQHSLLGGRTITGNRNSGERAFTGGKSTMTCSPAGSPTPEQTSARQPPPPTRPGSPEDSLGIHAQLRPTFACRRKDYYREAQLRRGGVHRRKWRRDLNAGGNPHAGAGECTTVATSAEAWFAGGQHPLARPAPANIRSQEEGLLPGTATPVRRRSPEDEAPRPERRREPPRRS
ncbi:hypothetical protein SAMN05216375_10729 [Trichococcus ilyis]|uniref:Uncharacterized protein n=1 Tax=Trichococcus ilyis TaxID=640938 RepID=A0A143YR98_9LACT|nr:Hypothetical protein TR210_1321 [Trichococcus ilyis]SEJ06485.1 hypothetical protein SAMN05216375_10729 [Trichococcus ilyis]